MDDSGTRSSEEFGVLLISEKATLTTFCILSLIRFSDVLGLPPKLIFCIALLATRPPVISHTLGIEYVYIHIEVQGFQ